MKTTIPNMLVVLVAVLFSLLSTIADAELIALEGRLDASTYVFLGSIDQTITRETPFSGDLAPKPGFDQQTSYGFADRITIKDLYPQDAQAEWGASFNSSSSGYEFNSSMYTEATAEPFLELSSGQVTSAATISMTFDRNTELDVYLRIDYSMLRSPSLIGGFTLDGLSGAPSDQFMIEHPNGEGYVEVSFRAVALAGESFTLSSEGMVNYTTISQISLHGWGSLDLTASVRVVPAPAGVLVLGGLGVCGLSRRR